MSERSLLIIEDDEIMKELIIETLNDDFGTINETSTISGAKDLLLEKSFDCIIIDIGLADGNGAEIIKYINDWDPGDNKETPKVIISGFINDTFKDKFKDSFAGILGKPFKPGDLQAVILIALGKNKKKKPSKKSDLNLVVDDSEVKNNDTNYEKEIEKKKTRPKPAMDLSLEFENEEVNLKVFEPTIHAPFKIENIDKRVSKTLAKVQKDNKLNELFKSIKVDPNDPYMMTHIGLLINISTGISIELDWGSDATLEKFFYASYLHDLSLGDSTELAKIDELSALDTSDSSFTKEEKDLVRLHPAASKKMIEHKAGIPQDVLTMIEQHHELPNGMGFPRGLDHKRITPLSSVFIFSHWLTDFIINDPYWSVDKFYMKYKTKIKGPHFRKAMRAIEALR